MNNNGSKSATRIRGLNGAFRHTFVGGAVVVTAGVATIAADQRRQKPRRFELISALPYGASCAMAGRRTFIVRAAITAAVTFATTLTMIGSR